MKADPASSLETPIPFWTESISDLPWELQMVVERLPDGRDCQWLFFPHEGVAGEAFQEYAVRAVGSDLEIALAVPVDGQTVLTIKAQECAGVRFENVLLLSRVTFMYRSGGSYSFQFNATGQDKLHALMQPFMVTLGGELDYATNAESLKAEGNSSAFSRMFMGLFADGESVTMAIQPSTVYHSVKRWFSNRLTPVPASAIALSNAKVAVASTTFDGQPAKFGQTVTMMPLDCVNEIGMLRADGETVGVTVAFGADQSVASVFSTVFNPGIADQLEDVCATFESMSEREAMGQELEVAMLAGVSAQNELVRLTGVDLPEREALEALVQIHRYKWLEAERAGFDTWAVIQPENPLRAAAVHWVRKYFGEFEQGIQKGAA